ncbi:MBL fold metallo-hydrolase [Sandaracinus amylolyticus]|uniref:Metallo-beta-lactamase superfamily protein n=1 Tax=Sandaracinus amylolyticus TaxID=927083 RepID=A0A0F6SGZ8_9BACT|nr:MBL fold metallo-hydrolase [Sandaracinus amylolyticus]AKF09569.1 Metallo-beta-lactamase superfamily protein [Sandaracinus amylolyticus]
MTKVHRIEGRVMLVNAHLVESAEGVVLVDGMLTVSDARLVRDAIAAIGKPLRAAIVTHAHPDHYAGLVTILADRPVPIHATPAVRAAIERDDAIKNEIVGPMMQGEWPTTRVFPDADVAPGTTLRVAGIAFDVVDLGPAESPADSLYRFSEREWFVGDLVYSRMHAYLADGFAAQWLAVLERLERELPRDAVLHVGHGEPGGRALVAAQRRYVEAFAESVERHRGAPRDRRRAAVVADMKRHLPTDDLVFLMELSVDPFAG